MKNGLLIWNVVLTLVAGYLLFNQFSAPKHPASVQGKVASNDSTASGMPFRIAYFEMDSVENNFQMVKDVKAEISKKEEAINMELDRMDRAYKTKVGGYQNQAQSMTQAESEQATQDVMQMQERMKATKQSLDQDYNDFLTRKMKDVKTKIEDFLKEYNKTKNYSYIIVYEQGLFYYKDTAYNITADVIKGLNEMYSGKAKKD
ncbi:MAG: OmpH family outer membrane protein [Chitinophagaceae bacterium]|nr:OmpH family outer membrane protein [Chitinophagaceae bacterium]